MKNSQALVLCLVVFYISSASADVNFYIDGTNGNDTNAGTSSAPFKTLARAENVSFTTENPDNGLVDFYVAPGVYTGMNNTGVTYRNSSRILFWNKDDSEATTLEFQCGSSLDQNKVYFNATNNFVFNGANSDGKYSAIISNCGTGILLSTSSTTIPYTVQVFNALFNENKLAISAVNVGSFLVQSSNFTNSPPSGTQLIYASGLAAVNSSFQIVDDVYFTNVGVIVADNFVNGKLSQLSFTSGNKGAFVLNGGSWDLDSLTISDVNSGDGGALYISGSATKHAKVDISESSFTFCSATTNGGAIYLRNTDASLEQVTFTQCTASESGGAIYFYNTTASSLEDLTFNRNSAAYGGGVELSGAIGSFSVSGLVFTNNSAFSNGSCLDCCQGAGNCGIVVNSTQGGITGSGNLDISGALNVTCTVVEDEEFSTAVSVSIDTAATYAGGDDGHATWWIWLIIAIVVAFILALIIGGVAYFIYQKKRNGYTRVE